MKVESSMEFDPDKLISNLHDAFKGEVKKNESLAPYTSYNIGGPTLVWLAPRTESDVGRVLTAVKAVNAPLFILGHGSNVLISDKGWQGVTLHLGRNLSGWSFKGEYAEVFSGTRLTEFIQAAVERGLAGMELMAGIPGGVGGALQMNAGAFGQEIESTTLRVKGFRLDGTPFQAERDKLRFAYRQAPDLNEVVITSAVFQFIRENTSTLKTRMADILALRAKKQPLGSPSCGSVFKRPKGYYASALIEEAGLKGERIGGAIVSRKHSGFVLNEAKATAADVYALIRRIEGRVLERFGVKLEREVKLVGEFD